MRLGLISQWLRAARSDPEHRACCLRYAGGIFVCQLGWIGLLAVPDALFLPGFLVLAAAELAVPLWAERAGVDHLAPAAHRRALRALHHHRAGRVLLAATIAVQSALDADGTLAELGAIAVGGLLTVFSMWWIYFDMPSEHVVDRARRTMTATQRGAFLWGYGHYFVFAARPRPARASPCRSTRRRARPSSRRPGRARGDGPGHVLPARGLAPARPRQAARAHAHLACPVAAALILAASAPGEPVADGAGADRARGRLDRGRAARLQGSASRYGRQCRHCGLSTVT